MFTAGLFPGLLLLGVSICNTVQAVEVIAVEAGRTDDRYTVDLIMVADLPEAFVREVLEDPDRVVRVNSALVEVNHLPSEHPGWRRFQDHTRSCILFYCVDYENTLNMRILDNRDIELTVEPAHSAFKYGVFNWHIEAIDAARTRLTFHSVSTPGFWVPATFILKSRMRQSIKEMIRHMECEYYQDALCIDPDWADDDAWLDE